MHLKKFIENHSFSFSSGGSKACFIKKMMREERQICKTSKKIEK